MRRFLIASLPLIAACSSPPPPPPPVAMLTDFGERDDAVALMRGVVLNLAPKSQLVDLTHQAPRFDVPAAARLLADAPAIYPPGTVFVVVVDPGVGTARRAVVARLDNGSLVVAPDNGVLTILLARQKRAEVRQVTNRKLQREAESATFHGRDVFAPVGGHLAAGTPFADVGPVIEDWVKLPLPEPSNSAESLDGEVISIDLPFGNVWTNLPADWLPSKLLNQELTVIVGELEFTLPFVATFGDIPEGQPLLYPNSRGTLAFALNRGDFATTHKIERGAKVSIALPKAEEPKETGGE